ncbi:hypothetical protein FBEOM_6419 [Fusarium beomiforme]|uniref:Uncharacterized protein n=1 Tax=Fusarium beomiforme TaxID=44412 RepID=A0A9P5AJ26_9HYPO|nr:hypothetical protein FBEOM_6419 [Fusarium beomiforme]
MSTTTVTHTQNGDFHSSILRDYELHHSQGREGSPDCRAAPAASLDHPEFDLPHRRVPAYRPLNTDAAHVNGVRVYTSTAERVFIAAMFRGLNVNATAAQTWRATVGRFTDKVWKYQIGGEF